MLPASSDLHYFVEVASTRNLSRAAERLGLSQPSLSLSIQRLESNIGVSLLIRSKKGVQLTQAGKQLLAQSRELLELWGRIKGKALASHGEVQGHFRLGCHSSVGIYSLPAPLTQILNQYPQLEIQLHHDLSRKIAEKVIQMELDLGIVVNPTRHPDLIIRPLCKDQVTFWSGKGRRKTQNLTGGEGVLICDPDLIQTQSLFKRMKKEGMYFNRMIPTSSLELITQLTVEGAGIGVIPGRVAALAKERGIKPIPGAPTFQDEICLIYRVENKGVRAIQEMVAAFSKEIR